MKVAIIGECMLELSMQEGGLYKMGYGGDTLNTAVYMSRIGGQCDYFTAIGGDKFSQEMLSQWQKDGVGTKHVYSEKGNTSGLYLIENDPTGERFFHYWRSNTPAKGLISNYPNVLDALKYYPIVYITGITLSIYSATDRNTLFKFFETYRAQGGVVVFDNNYRPASWPDKQEALDVYHQMMQLTDVALLSLDDEIVMYGEHSPFDCIARWQSAGVKEIVVKNGSEGCVVCEDNIVSEVPLDAVVKPLDTTAAGDSFNGAYLAAKTSGKSVVDCVKAGQFCASVVIQHKGAIIHKNIVLRRGA